jgi:hypothetical protein
VIRCRRNSLHVGGCPTEKRLLDDVGGGMILAMAHQRTQPPTPDLFSTTLVRNGEVSASKDTANGVSQRRVLPQDLPNAVKYLTDTELDLLITTAVGEAKRRGRLLPKIDRNPPGEPKQTPVELATGSLTRGQINAVQAAYKAGITPSRIAGQFGISQSDVRKALTADTTTKRVR